MTSSAPAVLPVAVSDHILHVPEGELFARVWRPATAAAGAPTLLLFHDSLGCTDLWRDFPEALAAACGLPVASYDRLGFGRSTPRTDRIGFDFMADEAVTGAAAAIDQLGMERFVTLGHSVGGAMAVTTAAAFPNTCVGVVTESAQAFVEDRTREGILEARTLFSDPAQVARLERYHGDRARWILDAWFETWLAPEFAAWSLDAPLVRLKAPLLALHGERDEYGSDAHPLRLAARAGAGGQARLLPDCGHVPHREKPTEVLQAIAGFLSARLQQD